ncbi:MAG: RNA methyltransferase, partial [Pseudomonadota bacterium]|nr:RNA methyltransferase [Pseudomonadota bacterium]
DQVTDPHNVGAVLRSACAFGAMAVFLTEKNAPDTTPALAKSACGALEHVPLVRVTNLARALSDLQKSGFWCVGLAESGQRLLSDVDLTGRTALVLGAEGSGLRRLTMETCDEVVRLPATGPIPSLNVSNAAAVALYEVARRR